MPKKLVDANPSWGFLRILLRNAIASVRNWLGMAARSKIPFGWGKHSQWFKNIQQRLEVEIEVGGRRMIATATRLSAQQAEQEFRDYAWRHPTAYRTVGSLTFGEQAVTNAEEFARSAKTIPVLVLRSREECERF